MFEKRGDLADSYKPMSRNSDTWHEDWDEKDKLFTRSGLGRKMVYRHGILKA